MEPEFLLEGLGVIDRDDVPSLELKDAVVLRDDPQGGRHLGHEQALASPSANQVDLLGIAAGGGADVHGYAGMTPADPQVAVLHDDGESDPGLMPALGGLAQPAYRPQELELVHEALLDSIYLGEVVEGLVGQLDVRHALKHGTENVAGPIPVPLVAGQQAPHELGPDDHFGVPAVGQVLENLLGLGVVLLGHEGFADPEFRLDRVLAFGVGILDRGKFASGGVETQPLKVILGQKQAHAGLFLIGEVLGLVVLDQPDGKEVLHALVVLVPTGRDVGLGSEKNQL